MAGCKQRMLKCVAGITWRDGVLSEEVARRYELMELSVMLRVRMDWACRGERK